MKLITCLSIILSLWSAADSAPSSNCECGIENLSTRVIRGHEARALQYPWMVHLKMVMVDGFSVGAGICTGSIINDRFILTAGHCIDENVRYMGVHANEHCMTGKHMNPATALKVKRVMRHERYGGPSTFHDIGLVELEKPLVFNETFTPICLPEFSEFDNFVAAGWGKREGGVNFFGEIEKLDTKCLREANLDVVPQWKCKRYHPYLNTDKAMCAGGHTGVCEGDSGGPLMTRKDGNVYQVGITSFGRKDCGIVTKTPSVFERVAAHYDWIRSKTRGAKWCKAKGSAVF